MSSQAQAILDAARRQQAARKKAEDYVLTVPEMREKNAAHAAQVRDAAAAAAASAPAPVSRSVELARELAKGNPPAPSGSEETGWEVPKPEAMSLSQAQKYIESAVKFKHPISDCLNFIKKTVEDPKGHDDWELEFDVGDWMSAEDYGELHNIAGEHLHMRYSRSLGEKEVEYLLACQRGLFTLIEACRIDQASKQPPPRRASGLALPARKDVKHSQ